MGHITLDQLHTYYIWLDPASGKRNTTIRSVRSRSALVVAGTDQIGRIWAVDAKAGRWSTNEIVANLLVLCQKWKPLLVGYEAMGQQTLLEDPINDGGKMLGIQVPLTPFTVSTKVDKNWRIRSAIQPLIGSGRLLINRALTELVNEITSFPMSSVNDLVDALASVCMVIPAPTTVNDNYDEVRELAHYLRESGAPPSEIEARVAEMGGYQQFDQTVPAWQRELIRRRPE